MKLLILIIIAMLLIYAGLQFMFLLRKMKMHKKEKQLTDMGITPYGSGLCHGMVLNSTKDGVIRDSKPSAAWYSRLV